MIAQVVSAVSDDLVNKVVEEVSKTSTEEKQNLSAKVLQAIVEKEPDKINIINDDVKDTMIEQTIEATKNQQESSDISSEADLTNIVAEIIVKTDAETAAKIIDEVNETETDSNLSLKVISGISEKDSELGMNQRTVGTNFEGFSRPGENEKKVGKVGAHFHG